MSSMAAGSGSGSGDGTSDLLPPIDAELSTTSMIRLLSS